MSVLIKGMSIPKECVKAEIYKDKDDKWVFAVKDKEYYTDTGFAEEFTLYELVEVPTLHGRLIDADVLEREMTNGIKSGNYEEGYEHYPHINDVDDCVECVRYADTIIARVVEE